MQGSHRSEPSVIGVGNAAVKARREAFLSGAEALVSPSPVRSEIAVSWKRSRQLGVEPDSIEVPYDNDAPTPHRLLNVAVPVIDRLASQLTDTSATILLANSDARIVRRWACRSFLPTLDRFNVAPGFSFSEHGVGTNGIGCAAEEKRLFEVRGPEHFRECLQSLVCVAAPIVLPTTNAVHGVLNVTCTIAEANTYLRPLLLGAIADIERQMLEAASARERLILDAYLSRTRRTANGVIAMSAEIVMANPVAEASLSSAERQVLWQWAQDALTIRSEAVRTLDRGDDGELVATATPIGDTRPPVGALIELRKHAVDRLHTSPRPHDPFEHMIHGHSSAARRLRRAMHLAAADRTHVVVTGSHGAGRTLVARAIATGGLADVAVRQLLGVPEHWPVDERAVLVRNIDHWDPDEVDALLAAGDAATTRIVATASDAIAGDGITRRFGHRVEVPRLERRSDDIPELSRRLLGELADSEPAPNLRRDALEALLRHDWPGNIAELRAVLSVALAAAGRGDLTLFHLPDAFHAVDPAERWTRIELAEREAIVRALSEHDGNKVAAAAALGLARSTLYRKLRAFQIDSA